MRSGKQANSRENADRPVIPNHWMAPKNAVWTWTIIRAPLSAAPAYISSSGRGAVVIVQHAAQPLAPLDRAGIFNMDASGLMSWLAKP